MKKLLLLSISALCLNVMARASTFTFQDTVNYFGANPLPLLNPGLMMNAAHVVQLGTFNITPGGSGGDSVTINNRTGGSGTGYVDKGVTYVDADGFLVGAQRIAGGSVTFYFRDDNDAPPESVRFELPSYFNSGTVNLINRSVTLGQIGANVDIIADLDADGKLNFRVSRVTGDFFFDYARLNATATPDGGSTVMLLGCGLVALEGLRRKLQSA